MIVYCVTTNKNTLFCIPYFELYLGHFDMKVYVSNDTKSVLSLSTNLYRLLFKLSNDLSVNHVSTRINKFIIIIIIISNTKYVQIHLQHYFMPSHSHHTKLHSVGQSRKTQAFPICKRKHNLY